MKLASIQKFTTAAVLALAVGLIWRFGAQSFAAALAVPVLVLLVYSGFLALEFGLMRRINRLEPAPQATLRETLKAWLAECVVAPQVFGWRQPFLSHRLPDVLGYETPAEEARPQRGVVFVHGFFCNRGLWLPWLSVLRLRRVPYIALNLEPVFGSIDDYVPQIEAAVARLTAATGLAPVLVCHSMGGLAARAWACRHGGAQRAHHVVTIGTPHRGTWLARFGHGKNTTEMRLDSPWQRALLESELKCSPAQPAPSVFTCWYSNADNIVFPASNATLPSADNRMVRGAAHVDLAFVPEIMAATLRMLD